MMSDPIEISHFDSGRYYLKLSKILWLMWFSDKISENRLSDKKGIVEVCSIL